MQLLQFTYSLAISVICIASFGAPAHAESALTGREAAYDEEVNPENEQSFSQTSNEVSTNQVYGQIETSTSEDADAGTALPWEFINVRPFPANPIQRLACRGCDLAEDTLYYQEPNYICAFDLSKLPGLTPEQAKKRDIRLKLTFKDAIDAGIPLTTCGPVLAGITLTPCKAGESKVFSKALVPDCDYSIPVREADGSWSYTCDQKPSSWLGGHKVEGAPPVLQTCQRPTVAASCPTLVVGGDADRNAVCDLFACEISLPGAATKFSLPCSAGLDANRVY